MLLETLPNAVLDAVVECAGFDQGWRLEVVCASLRASSMECAASRLGKCRWIGESPRAGTEFKPCWRHVAVATRSGQYVLSFAGGVIHPLLEFSYPPQGPIDIGSGYMTFTDGPSGDIGVGSRTTTSRRQAMKFVVEPAPCLPAFTAGGPQNRAGPEARRHLAENIRMLPGPSVTLEACAGPYQVPGQGQDQYGRDIG